jgi:hypothetical protein
MAVRIRQDGRILCAAHHAEMIGDTYIDDELHYQLSAESGVLVTLPMPQHAEAGPYFGQWWWGGQVPDSVEVEYTNTNTQ